MALTIETVVEKIFYEHCWINGYLRRNILELMSFRCFFSSYFYLVSFSEQNFSIFYSMDMFSFGLSDSILKKKRIKPFTLNNYILTGNCQKQNPKQFHTPFIQFSPLGTSHIAAGAISNWEIDISTLPLLTRLWTLFAAHYKLVHVCVKFCAILSQV